MSPKTRSNYALSQSISQDRFDKMFPKIGKLKGKCSIRRKRPSKTAEIRTDTYFNKGKNYEDS